MKILRPVAIALLLSCSGQAADRTPRYVAVLTDGTRLEGSRLSNWHETTAMPQLDGQPLLTPTNPLRWLRDRTKPLSSLPASFIEFTNGDRLPGMVVDYRDGSEDRYRPLPPHFVVRVPFTLEPPENKPVLEIRVGAQFVRRIVWQPHRGLPAASGSAIFRDGRSLSFRAARFHASVVHVLFTDGDRRIGWNELTELHLPASDPWAAWFDQLAAICPSNDSKVIDIETFTGLSVMASSARLVMRFEGNSSDPDRWVHGLQPAWSLDILWVPFREIAYYRMFAPFEAPLNRITPRQITTSGGIVSLGSVESNRSALGGPLQNQAVDFGFGLGMRGGMEVTFDLPPAARSLKATVCIDRTAGSGGCTQPRVLVADEKMDATTKPRSLWQGPILVGSASAIDSGPIPLGESKTGGRTLSLQSDMVAHDRPSGADPLDIRDYANWCDLLLTLDPAAVQAELDTRIGELFSAWRDWQVEVAGGPPADAGVEVSFYRTSQLPGAFEPLVRATKRPLVLRREVTIAERDRWLVIWAAARPKNLRPQAQLEVWVNGQQKKAFAVPDQKENPADNRPMTVSLAGYATTGPERVMVEVRQLPTPNGQAVAYQAITTAESLPADQAFRLP